MGNPDLASENLLVRLIPTARRAQVITDLESLKIVRAAIGEVVEDVRENGVFHSDIIGGFIWRHTIGTHCFEAPDLSRFMIDPDH